MPNWYALHVRTGWERRIAADLERRAVENYLPLVRVRHTWSDRNKILDQPAFPGYVLVRMSAESAPALNVHGMFRLLGTNTPEPIPDDQVAAVRRVLESSGMIGLMLCAIPKAGDQVEVISGEFTGVVGACEWIEPKRCIVAVAINLLGRAVAVPFYADEVRIVRVGQPAVPKAA